MEQSHCGNYFGRGRALLMLAALALAAPAARLGAADWLMFRGNAARTGFSAEQASPPLTKVWEFTAGGGIISSPVVYEGLVYFGARDNKLYAFDAYTGAPAWEFRAGGWIDASPAVSASAVYAVSTDGWLYALGRRNGVFMWKAALGAPSVSSPLLLDGKVYVGVGAPAAKLKAFDAASGAPAGEYAVTQPVDSAPSSDGTRIYFGANDGRLYALNKDTLTQLWSYQTMGGRYGRNAAAVKDGVLYAVPGFDENKPLALDAAAGTLLNAQTGPFEGDVTQPDGSVAWRQVGSPAVSADRLYFSGGSTANLLYSLTSAASAQALLYVWPSTPTLGAVSPTGLLSSPSMAGDVIYAGTVDGALVAYSSAGAAIPLGADGSFAGPVYASPAVSNGMVFAAGFDGKFSAYRAGRAAAISEPADGAVVNGSVDINGYIYNPLLTGYTVEYSTGGTPEVWTGIYSSATASSVEGRTLAVWETSSLENGIYVVRLTALESGPGDGNYSRVTVRVNSAPLPPEGLAAADRPADGGNAIDLSWTASPTAAVSAYRVYREDESGWALLASVSSSTLAYTDAAALTGSTFTYSVRAFDGYAESEESGHASAFSVNDLGDNTPPEAVADLTVSAGPAYGVLTLRWTAPGNDGDVGEASRYIIKRSTVAGFDWGTFDSAALEGGTRPVEGPAGITEQEDVPGLFGGVTYYFALKTVDAVPNTSALSNVASACAARDPLPPVPPSSLAAADTPGDGGGSISLSWELSPDDGEGGDVYGYKLFRRLASSSYVSTAPHASLDRGASFYTDASATENVRYYYAVSAFDSGGDSRLSPEAYAVSANNWRYFDASRGVSVRLEDGARLDIPDNAASQNDNLMMNRLDPDSYQPLFRVSSALSANPTGIVYRARFESAVTRLLRPAVISLPYTPAETAGMEIENLRLYSLSASGAWAMLNTSSVDPAAGKVSAEVTRLSTFAIMEYRPSGSLFDAGEVYTYPNPATGDTLTFKFRVASKSSVKLNIYNVAGQRVARLEKSNCPAGVASELVWNIRNIASGVYQYRFEAVSADGAKSVVKRLAIVH